MVTTGTVFKLLNLGDLIQLISSEIGNNLMQENHRGINIRGWGDVKSPIFWAYKSRCSEDDYIRGLHHVPKIYQGLCISN